LCFLPQPNLDVEILVISRRIVRASAGRGLLIADPFHPRLDLVPGSGPDHPGAASIQYRIAFGRHAGHKALKWHSMPPLEETNGSASG